LSDGHTDHRAKRTDHMSTTRWPTQQRARIAFWALAAVSLLISHDAIWLTQVGPGEVVATALRSGGHAYWGAASVGLLIIGLTVTGVVVLRLLRLHQQAARLGVATPLGVARAFPARAAIGWARLFAVVSIGFVIQENIEHYLSHQHTLGMGALLGPEYPLALPVIAALTGIAGLFAATVRTWERGLIAAILAAHRMRLRPSQQRLRAPRRSARLPWSPLAAAAAGRAPPLLLEIPRFELS
jgi:hypothetical protein